MFQKLIRKIRIKRYAKKTGEFIIQHKDCKVKEIRMIDGGSPNHDGRFNNASYLHLHCEGDDKRGDLYISFSDKDNIELWKLMLFIGIGADYKME